MTLHPDKLPLLHGLVDGELDAANTVAIEAHLKTCRDCRAELARIEAVREALVPLRGQRAPQDLRGGIEARLAAETGVFAPRRPARAERTGGVPGLRWAGGALVGALAATLVILVGLPQVTRTDTEDQLVQSHVRSLLASHLVDVATSDRHVVKPWFNGKVDFAPATPDLADEGFALVGGRLDYVDDREVAAIVYRRRLHVINLFVRPAKTLSLPAGAAARRDGYSLLHWTAGGLEYWAVSDVELPELRLFQRLYAARATS